MLALDLDVLHREAGGLLREVIAEFRAGYSVAEDGSGDPRLQPGADLAGANFRGRQLCGADLRGACLIGTDLRGADLTGVDLLGADLRDARLDGADLTGALFLTQAQLNSARGNETTLFPRVLARPGHWLGDDG